ncbi:MAG: hypothetical protein ACOY90_10265 [Candidatus Zhuqueibacterota bacterium]
MKKRVAKKILKNQDQLKYKKQQVADAMKKSDETKKKSEKS